jgi:hypothetical protein
VIDTGPGAKPKAALRVWLASFVRFALTGLLLWATLHKVPLQGIRAAIARVDPRLTTLSLLFFVAATLLVESARLTFAGLLLRERQPRCRDWLRIFAESRPFYYLLPGAAAAEGMVWVRLRQLRWRHTSCGFVVLSTRIWGVATWGLAAAYALSLPRGTVAILAQVPAWMRAPGTWAAGAALAAGIALLAPGIMARRSHLEVRSAIALPSLAMAMASAASVAIVTLAVMLAAAAAGTPLPWQSVLGLMAVFNFAMVLPISLGGFGLQEALVLRLGLAYGYSAPALVAFSAILHLQRLALSLVGLAVFLPGRRSAARPVLELTTSEDAQECPR